MANDKIGIVADATGMDLYAMIVDRERDYCDIEAADGSFETFVVASIGTYDLALTETPASSARYEVAFPSFVAAGRYKVEFYEDVAGGAGTPQVADILHHVEYIDWDGSAILNGANVEALNLSTPAAVNLKQSALALQVITVQTAEAAANTNTIFDTDLPLENANYYGSGDGGLVVAFVSGAAQQFQTRRIVASATGTANTRVTLEEALDGIPSDADVMVVLGRISELS